MSDFEASKVIDTACVIPLPLSLSDSIQSVRAQYDRYFTKWPPCIQLLYPFRRVSDFPTVIPALIQVLASVHPFDIMLSSVHVHAFSRRNFSLFLHYE